MHSGFACTKSGRSWEMLQRWVNKRYTGSFRALAVPRNPPITGRDRDRARRAAGRRQNQKDLLIRATNQGAGNLFRSWTVLRTIFRAIATSAPETVIGNLDPWRTRLDLSAVRMAQRIGRAKPSNAPSTPPVRRSSGPQRGETIRGCRRSARILSGTLLPRSRLEFVGGVFGHGNQT